MVMRSALLQLKKYNLIQIILTLSFVSVFYSCVTVPPKADLETDMQLLPSYTDVIIKVDIQSNSEIINPLALSFLGNMSEKNINLFLEKTETVLIGLDYSSNSEDGKSRSSIVAIGDFPKGLIGIGLDSSKEWLGKNYEFKNLSNKGIKYWQAQASNTQLAIPDSKTILASTGDIEQVFTAWAEKPNTPVSKEWLYSEANSDISILTRNLGPEDYGKFIPELKKVPIESLLLSLKRNNESYEISGKFYMESEASAFLFSVLFKTMILVTKDDNGEKLFPDRKLIKIKKEKKAVILEGMVLPIEEILKNQNKWLNLDGKQEASAN